MAATFDTPVTKAPTPAAWRGRFLESVSHHPTLWLGVFILTCAVLVAVFAPWLAPYDPLEINPIERLKPPSAEHWFGTDAFGRDVFSRTVHGSRVSLQVGAGIAVLSTFFGLVIGLVAGYFRRLDAIIMRIMDAMMAIPGILLAIALMTLSEASVMTVIIAITIPEIPRMVRVVRSVVLTIREQVYVQAAIAAGTRTPRLLVRHVLPNTLAPVIVQATFIGAFAVIIEASLSFLGAGTPPEIPSWGNIMAEARSVIQLAPWIIVYPGLCLGVTVLSINLLGDGLRDMVDPRFAKSFR
jgi:peptide/nickel transport system permease protein